MWKRDKCHGYGELFIDDNSQYKGYFKNGVKHGSGKEEMKNGWLYEGEY